MKYLLDTNICIALINDSSDKARATMQKALLDRATMTTSSIVVHELWYGVAKSIHVDSNASALHAFLNRAIEMLDYTPQDAAVAAEIRADLERKGTRIGEYDTLIAGQALARGLVLVTANTREFKRVKGLKVEDWTI